MRRGTESLRPQPWADKSHIPRLPATNPTARKLFPCKFRLGRLVHRPVQRFLFLETPSFLIRVDYLAPYSPPALQNKFRPPRPCFLPPKRRFPCRQSREYSDQGPWRRFCSKSRECPGLLVPTPWAGASAPKSVPKPRRARARVFQVFAAPPVSGMQTVVGGMARGTRE